MEKVKFGQLFAFQKKSNLKASEEDINGKYPFYTSSPIINKRTNNPLYDQVSLVIGNGGSANIHYADVPFAATSHCYIAVARSSDVNTKFVYYYLATNLHTLERGFKGAGLKNISAKYVEELEIPLPELETQNKIVAILDKAKSILDKRERAVSKYDELLRASFLEMFGDPVINQKKWDKNLLEFLCEKIIDCPHETPEYLEEKSDFYCIRSSDIQNDYIDLNDTKTVSEETYSKRIARHKPVTGEVIYTREGGRLGNAARVPDNVKICLGQRMMLFKANEHIANNEFIWALLNSDSIKNKVKNMSGGGAAPRINIKQLRELEIIVPTRDLQTNFASIVNKIDDIKRKLNASLQEINHLINSLSQLAFEGNLDFNTAVDLEVLLESDYEFFKENSNSNSIKLLLERLNTDELNENKFYEQQTYDKAKSFVFELLKEGKVQQVFDEKAKKSKLTVE